jgi:Sulfotransferase domain
MASSLAPLPTFIIIGAQKSATRWLRFNLNFHPQVYVAPNETRFFHSLELFHARGLEWYQAQFPGWKGEPIVGESTPGYMMRRHRPKRVATRIVETVPDVRLIALLRNPIDRAQSAMVHFEKRGKVPPVSRLLELVGQTPPQHDPLCLVAGGWYAASLRPYQQLFGDQLLVLLHDDLTEDPRRVYEQALLHIGASPDFVPPDLTTVLFSNQRAGGAGSSHGSNGSSELSNDERQRLFAYFRDDVRMLEKMIGRDLSRWDPGGTHTVSLDIDPWKSSRRRREVWAQVDIDVIETGSIADAQRLDEEGRTLEAIDLLTVVNRARRDPMIERLLVRLRHAAWQEIDPTTPRADWFPPERDLFDGARTTPEVSAERCDAVVIRSAIQHHGALIVRGLFSNERCTELRASIDHAWDAIDAWRRTKSFDPAWFDPMKTDGYGLNMISRTWGIENDVSYAADSPRLFFDLVETLHEAGVMDVVTDYFGESPVFSLPKTSHRRLRPDASGSWHQDAAVYGLTTRALNLWIPISRCGDVAPGLEIWPGRLDHVLETVGTGVPEYETKASAVEALTSEAPSYRPVFEPGDGLLFDQMLLNTTSASPRFTEPQYGFECWFFARSTLPEAKLWIPIVC